MPQPYIERKKEEEKRKKKGASYHWIVVIIWVITWYDKCMRRYSMPRLTTKNKNNFN
jgi:hypothetical protein